MPTPLDIAVVRPATLDDVDALVAISSQVGIGHSKPDIVREDVAFSQSLLRGESAWNQGPLYLCSEAFSADMRERHGVVGQCKLEMMAAGVWRKKDKYRRFLTGGTRVDGTFEYLEYDAGPKNALEFAANAVHTSHRGKGIGSLHIRARMLLLRHLLKSMPQIQTIVSVTLTQEDTEKSKAGGGMYYPFYEQCVKPFFGNRDFDTIDTLRYQNRARDGSVQFVDEFLQGLGENDPPRTIPMHLMPPEARKQFGCVRKDTNRTHEFFLRMGFEHRGRHDVLDSSVVLETPRARFEGIAEVDRYTAKADSNAGRSESDKPRVFMASVSNPDWTIADFRCVRAPVTELPGKVLGVHPMVLGLVGARNGDALDVLAVGGEAGGS
jgi:arginine/ornithine N-succinyltransferase beta subunit